MIVRTSFMVLISFLSASLAFSKESAPLHIAVASNFKQVHKALVSEFKRQSGSINPRIVTSSGSSGTLFAQIKHGAPYDVFLSADQMRPDKLINLGLAHKKSRTIYAQGQIALWKPTASQPFDISIIKQDSDRYVLANPKLAPYGAASQAIMINAGLWKTKDNARIVAQNIASAFQYVASGSVKIGWVALSQLKNWEKKTPVLKHHYWLPPLNKYPVIHQVAVQLAHAKNKILAAKYLTYLTAPKAQTLIRSFGYLSPSI